MKGREAKIPRSAKSVILRKKVIGPEIGARKEEKLTVSFSPIVGRVGRAM